MTWSPSPKQALLARGLRPKNSFGQNFLADESISAKIAALATTPPGGTVVEIGAGLGSLTRPLLGRAARVVAIERDRDLVPALAETFSEAVTSGALRILEADAKAVDYESLLAEGPGPHTLAGNLPYQITGPLLERTVALAPRLERVVYMVQLEVADRLAAKADGEHYGALSVFMQAAFSVERAFVVKRGAFYPQPNVDSAVVVFTPKRPPVSEETPVFRAVVRAAFAARRKTLRNAWKSLPGVDPTLLKKLAESAGIDLDARGETLDVSAFARMATLVAEATS
jgi:16S rRNA (adenine1518-N6/adenine1519-N6)-dimethyltransferase